MNTLYVRCQTKDYILDIVAARAGMRINKVNSIKILLHKLRHEYAKHKQVQGHPVAVYALHIHDVIYEGVFQLILNFIKVT